MLKILFAHTRQALLNTGQEGMLFRGWSHDIDPLLGPVDMDAVTDRKVTQTIENVLLLIRPNAGPETSV